MFRRHIEPHRLFDRPWQAGHPFCRRTGKLRRVSMMMLLGVLSAIIFVYGYVTDSQRVRAMAESYLGGLVGGRVEVGGATLSVFEGLRLENVRVHADPGDTADASADSLLFSAQTFVVKYDPIRMLTGKLEATQIIVQKPFVHLTDNVDTGTWNWHRLMNTRSTRPRAPGPVTRSKPKLPEILLRNASVEISEIRDARHSVLGSISIDGRLAAAEDGSRYLFDLQSRGMSESVDPFLSGSISPGSGQVSARIMNFRFVRGLRSMLPEEVRTLWERYELAGEVDIPVLNYTAPRDGKPAGFRVETQLHGVTLSLPPDGWLSTREMGRLQDVRGGVDMLRRLRSAAGFAESLTDDQPTAGSSERLASMLRRFPVKLHDVSGRFVCTESGIQIDTLKGKIEDSGIEISGRIEGYRPNAPLKLQISSPKDELLTVPDNPRYVSSLPPVVRNLYTDLRPRGTARLLVDIDRPTPGSMPVVSGVLEVVDGHFTYEKFPYPLRNASGRVLFGRDSQTGMDRVALENIRGRGMAGGPNADTYITINGRIEPLGPTAGVHIMVTGDNVQHEQALQAALPPPVRDALKIFDADGAGAEPKFAGSFVCNVVRPLGYRTNWSFDTDIHLSNASGKLTMFAYPLNDVQGTLNIRTGYADVKNFVMKKGDSTLAVDGRVTWPVKIRTPASPPTTSAEQPRDVFRLPDGNVVKTDLRIVAKNVPIDDSLLGALPQAQRDWLAKSKAAGTVDVAGRVFNSPTVEDPTYRAPEYAFDVTLRDGKIRPLGGEVELSSVGGAIKVLPTRVELNNISGTRGKSTVRVNGQIGWKDNVTRARLAVNATNMPLDEDLRAVLPPEAKLAWDELGAKGTIDTDVHYDGPLGATEKSAGFRTVIRPRELAVKLKGVPYPLEQVKGAVTVDPAGNVLLENITAKRGDAAVTIAGTGLVGKQQEWNLSLKAHNVPIDDALREALPKALTELIDSMKIKGTLNVDFAKLNFQSPQEPQPTSMGNEVVAVALDADPLKTNPRIELVGTVALQQGSMETGVTLTNIDGAAQLDALIAGGKLNRLNGEITADSLAVTGREMKKFHCIVIKPADKEELRLEKMQGELAQGEFAGGVTVSYPEQGESQYHAELLVRGADVKTLLMDKDADIKGQLSASLSLEGKWDDANARRGRGDIVVVGKEMYRMPLLLGLSQIATLSLPISTPFSEATAKYSLQGPRVAFDSIQLQAGPMLLNGDGSMDFETKKVALAFTTSNPAGLKVPFINELLQQAQQELFKIHVKGTIQEPEVAPGTMGTFTTTVDSVLRGDEPEKN